MAPQTRNLYIISFDSPLYPAHWALWIPTIDAEGIEQSSGREIQVEGDAYSGFVHFFRENCDLSKTTRKHKLTFLGIVDSENIRDCAHDANLEVRQYNEATDRLEELALEVPAPRKTLSSVNPLSSGPPKKNIRILNCQNWMYDFIAKLVEEKILGPEALENIKKVPRN